MINEYLNDNINAENIHIYDTIGSTNTLAKEMALSGAPHGTVVIANEQTAGRGRFGRKFYSPMGSGLYMSIILDTSKLNQSDITRLTCYAAVITCKAIEECQGALCKIKWVNDLYIEDKKVCGILAEGVSSKRNGSIDKIIVGIGININTREFPEEIKDIATSIAYKPILIDDKILASCPKAEDIRDRIAAAIINCFFAEDGDFDNEKLMAEYKSKQMIIGKKVIVISGKDKYEATAIDIDDEGRLIVRKEDGEAESIFSGEVSIKLG